MTAAPGMALHRVADAEGPRYAALLGGSSEVTFFHTRTWARIVTEAFPQLRDDSGVFAIGDRQVALPLFRWRRLGGLIVTTHSSFPFLYGGPIPSAPETWAVLLRHVSGCRGSWIIQGNPFGALPSHVGIPSGGATAAVPPPVVSSPAAAAGPLSESREVTHLLRLPSSVDTYWGRVLTTQKRNDIRRLTKKGVRVELSRAAGDVAQVYGLYRRRMATWAQRPGLVYPLKLYQAMLTAGGDAVRLYVARYEDRLIGGTFVCRYNGIVHYNAGYFDDRYRRLRPNVLIQERIIRDAIEDRMRIYDMLPSAGLASVAAFKESFGGVPTPFPRWRKTSSVHRLLFGLRAALLRQRAREEHDSQAHRAAADEVSAQKDAGDV